MNLSAPNLLKVKIESWSNSVFKFHQIASTLRKAFAMEGPVLVGVNVDYRDNHKLMEMVHPEALD